MSFEEELKVLYDRINRLKTAHIVISEVLAPSINSFVDYLDGIEEVIFEVRSEIIDSIAVSHGVPLQEFITAIDDELLFYHTERLVYDFTSYIDDELILNEFTIRLFDSIREIIESLSLGELSTRIVYYYREVIEELSLTEAYTALGLLLEYGEYISSSTYGTARFEYQLYDFNMEDYSLIINKITSEVLQLESQIISGLSKVTPEDISFIEFTSIGFLTIIREYTFNLLDYSAVSSLKMLSEVLQLIESILTLTFSKIIFEDLSVAEAYLSLGTTIAYEEYISSSTYGVARFEYQLYDFNMEDYSLIINEVASDVLQLITNDVPIMMYYSMIDEELILNDLNALYLSLPIRDYISSILDYFVITTVKELTRVIQLIEYPPIISISKTILDELLIDEICAFGFTISSIEYISSSRFGEARYDIQLYGFNMEEYSFIINLLLNEIIQLAEYIPILYSKVLLEETYLNEYNTLSIIIPKLEYGLNIQRYSILFILKELADTLGLIELLPIFTASKLTLEEIILDGAISLQAFINRIEYGLSLSGYSYIYTSKDIMKVLQLLEVSIIAFSKMIIDELSIVEAYTALGITTIEDEYISSSLYDVAKYGVQTFDFNMEDYSLAINLLLNEILELVSREVPTLESYMEIAEESIFNDTYTLGVIIPRAEPQLSMLDYFILSRYKAVLEALQLIDYRLTFTEAKVLTDGMSIIDEFYGALLSLIESSEYISSSLYDYAIYGVQVFDYNMEQLMLVVKMNNNEAITLSDTISTVKF